MLNHFFFKLSLLKILSEQGRRNGLIEAKDYGYKGVSPDVMLNSAISGMQSNNLVKTCFEEP